MSNRRTQSQRKQSQTKDETERLIRSFPLQLIVQVGQLVHESVIGMNFSVHSHSPNRLLGSHFPGNHEVSQCQRGGPGNSHQTVHQHPAPAIHAVLNELGRYVEVPGNVRGWCVRQWESHVTEVGEVIN